MVKTITSLQDLAAEARALIENLKPREDRATLITLSGELGAGKTAFTKAIAEALGVGEPVTSPTFVLLKGYLLPEDAPFTHLLHIDAYRLKGGDELGALGFEEAMRTPQNLIILEWPECVREALPIPALHITLTLQEDGSRTLSYQNYG